MNRKPGTWLAAALAVALAAPAAAQDRGVYDWTGFYVGGGAGYASGGINHRFNPGSGGFGPGANGLGMWARDDIGGSFTSAANFGLYGAHAGYLQQWDRLVGGVEASFDFADLNAGTTNAFGELTPTTGYFTQLKWLATLTPRLGWAWDGFQIYGKAGIAMGRVASLLTADDNACLPRCTFTGEAIHVGLTVGAGMAFALSPSWILGLEYDYYDLGLENYGGQTQSNTFWNVAYGLQPRFSAVRGRISWRFGAPPASTADAAAPPAGPAEPAPPWQGFYIGANAGFGWGSSAYNFAPIGSGNGSVVGLFAPTGAGGYFSNGQAGSVYGLHAGFNRQWDRLVGGVEFSLALTDIQGQVVNPFGGQTSPNASYATNVKWLATLAPRVGWTWDPVMVYGKAGLPVARLSSQLNSSNTTACDAGGFGATSTCSFTEERTHVGVVVGVGVEYQLGPNWSLGVEYNYADLSTESYGGTINPNTTWPLAYTVHPQISTVRGRISYRL